MIQRTGAPPPVSPSSSPRMAWSGKARPITWRIEVSASRSAAVTGVASAFHSTATPALKCASVRHPPAVPDTGPLNLHFVRDIGAAFTTIGVALCVAAVRPGARRGVLFGATLFFVLHAAVHVADLLTGRLAAGHWLIDLPGVFLPALLLVALCLRPETSSRVGGG